MNANLIVALALLALTAAPVVAASPVPVANLGPAVSVPATTGTTHHDPGQCVILYPGQTPPVMVDPQGCTGTLNAS